MKMKRNGTICTLPLLLLALLFLSLSLGLGQAALATEDAEGGELPEQRELHIGDAAGLFSEQEAEQLIDACQDVYQKHDTHITIITMPTLNGASSEQYLEDVYDEIFASLDYSGTVLFLANMDSTNREMVIQGYGKSEDQVNDSDIQSILNDIRPDMANGNYYLAMRDFIAAVGREAAPPFYMRSWFSLLVALAIAGIVVFCMAYQSGGKVTVNESTYMDANNSRLLARHDRYLRTQTTRRRKPSESTNSSSGGGGGRSSGGHSHSGGSMRF